MVRLRARAAARSPASARQPQASSGPMRPPSRASMAAAVAASLARAASLGEIGAEEDQGFGAAPEALDHLRHRFARDVAHHQGQNRDLAQDALEEGELHLQAMLAGVGGVVLDHLGEAGQGPERRPVDRQGSEGAVEGFGMGRGDGAESDRVGRAQQDDPADRAGEGLEARAPSATVS